jgi:cytochrome c-type biogenesis protein CcmH/NrfF
MTKVARARAGARPLLAVSLLVAVAAVPVLIFPADAQQPQSAQMDRTKQIGTKLKCMCGGCQDSAGTCYHTGGAFSGPCDTAKAELREVKQHVDLGESDDLIVQAFVQQYGPQVYVEPPHQGIGRLAWWMPAGALIVGLALVIFIISRWSKRPTLQTAGVGAGASAANTNIVNVSPELLARARAQAARETED